MREKVINFVMRVHLVRKETIEDWVGGNARSRKSFSEWLLKLKFADWSKPEDIQATFCSADLLGKGSNRVVFDLGGNNYRMICKYAFGVRQVHLFVCWKGTHTSYDKVCKKGEQYIVQNY